MFLYQSSARICYFEAVSLFLSSSLAWMMLCIFLDSFCQVGSENSPIMKQTAWITMIILIYENILIYKNINFIQNIKNNKTGGQQNLSGGIWIWNLSAIPPERFFVVPPPPAPWALSNSRCDRGRFGANKLSYRGNHLLCLFPQINGRSSILGSGGHEKQAQREFLVLV